MHLLPSMEAATEAHGANLVGPSVVYIMKEHLIPALSSSKCKSHDVVENRPCTVWVMRKEVVPGKRVVEICDQHPRKPIAAAGSTSDREHKPPALGQIKVIGTAAAIDQAAN
mmetsp:Transcript_73671/g.130358  ORF Transcript_73671/g.130358 Transcript_73671/m.130358 type:complete len:112 (+) Transcript_73671:369-704(+)